MIYISDLDGTLLRTTTTLSNYAAETLSTLLKNGVLFTIATARSVVSTKQILGSLPLQLPIVEANGAYVTDYQTEKHLITHEFPIDIKEALLSFLLEHNCPPLYFWFRRAERLPLL